MIEILMVEALRPLTNRIRTDVTCVKTATGAQAWTREALTDERLLKHLNGGPARGCCPIREGESVTSVALYDFDSHRGELSWAQMTEKAMEVFNVLELNGMRPVAFRSSGGRGIHLFLMWDDPQDAYSVRQFMKAVLRSCGLRDGSASLARGEVEIFPKQDSVAVGKWGNQFILPLAGQSVPLEPMADLAPLPREAILFLQWPLSSPVEVSVRPVREKLSVVRTGGEDEGGGRDLTQLKAWLAAIPNSGYGELDYDDWRNVIFGIHHETGGSDEGLLLALEFSAKAEGKFNAEFLEERVWPYIRDRDDGITGRTVQAVARKWGWREDVSGDFEDLTEEAKTAAEEEWKPNREERRKLKFHPIPIHEFAKPVKLHWIMKRIIPAAELVIVFGAPGSGKSFLVIDMAFAIARGVPWKGHKVTQGRVVYVAAEGSNGVRTRMRAYAHEYGLDLAQIPFTVFDASPNFMQSADAIEMTKSILVDGPCALIIVDTFSQTTAGCNENSGEDVGKVLSHCKQISKHCGAPVLFIHHSGKDEARGARGWSGLRGACDAEIEVVALDGDREARLTKQKDGEEGATWGFTLRPVTLEEVDEDGEPIVSCVIEHVDRRAPLAAVQEPRGANDRLVLRVLNDLLDLNGVVMLAELRAAAMNQIPFDPGLGQRDTRPQRITRAIENLRDAGRIVVNGLQLTLPERN